MSESSGFSLWGLIGISSVLFAACESPQVRDGQKPEAAPQSDFVFRDENTAKSELLKNTKQPGMRERRPPKGDMSAGANESNPAAGLSGGDTQNSSKSPSESTLVQPPTHVPFSASGERPHTMVISPADAGGNSRREKRVIFAERGLHLPVISELLPADSWRNMDNAKIAIQEGFADEVVNNRWGLAQRSWIKDHAKKVPDQEHFTFIHHSEGGRSSRVNEAARAIAEHGEENKKAVCSHHILYDPTGLEGISTKEWDQILDRPTLCNLILFKATEHANMKTFPVNHPKVTVIYINEIYPHENPEASLFSNHWKYLTRADEKSSNPQGYDLFKELYRLTLGGASPAEIQRALVGFKIRWNLNQAGFTTGNQLVKPSPSKH